MNKNITGLNQIYKLLNYIFYVLYYLLISTMFTKIILRYRQGVNNLFEKT